MKNFIQEGNTLNVTLLAAAKSGDVVHVGKLLGIAAVDGAIGETIAVTVEGVVSIAKNPADSIGQGAALAWDSANGVVTPTVGVLPLIGYSSKAAAAGTATVEVKLCPTAA